MYGIEKGVGVLRRDSMMKKHDGHRRAAQDAVAKRTQITIGCRRNDERIKRSRLRHLIELAIPAEPTARAPERDHKFPDAARMCVGNGSAGEMAHLSMIVHSKTKAFGHIEHDLMSERFQFLHKNTIKVDLVTTRRHDVFKDGNFHMFPLLFSMQTEMMSRNQNPFPYNAA